jgi:hypothetical protein
MNEAVVEIDENLFKSLFQKNNKIFSIVSKIDKPILLIKNARYNNYLNPLSFHLSH